MALPNHIEARVNYLQKAAHLLAIPSPAAAAILGNARDRYVEEAGLTLPPKETDTFRREICGACGSPLIPGWSCTVSIQPQAKRERKNGPGPVQKTTTSETRSIYTCLRCRRETMHTVQQRIPCSARRSKTHSAGLDKTPGQANSDTVPKTANASSRQRQKARKGGLQAMLDKNKTAMSSSGGFDLMDFAM